MLWKFWKYIGGITKVWRSKPAALTATSTRAFPVKMRDLEAPAGQLLAIGQRRPDQVLNPGGAGGLHGRPADFGLARHLGGIPEVGHDEGSVRPCER